jgi:hypothetical protein
MIAVPFPTSREYNSAPPTGIRLSFGVAIRSLSGEAVESEANLLPMSTQAARGLASVSWR